MLGLVDAAQFANPRVLSPTGGQTRIRTSASTMAANEVTIGTKRLPAKKPRKGGSLILKKRLKSTAAMPPIKMPPRTPVSIDLIPMMVFVSIPRTTANTPSAACSTAYPTTAASAATPSLLANPSATPIAKMSGKLEKIAPPDWAITFETIAGIQLNFALPTPNNMPATGSTDTGSINDLPIFCSVANAFLKNLIGCLLVVSCLTRPPAGTTPAPLPPTQARVPAARAVCKPSYQAYESAL